MSPGFASEIDVTVVSAQGAVCAVDIRPRSRPAVIRLVAGKDVAVLRDVLPRLFALCARAHQLACACAIRAARDEPLDGVRQRECHVALIREWIGELLRGLHVAGLLSADGGALRDLMRLLAACGGDGRDDVGRQLGPALERVGISISQGIALPGSALARSLNAVEAMATMAPAPAWLLSPEDDEDVVTALFAHGEAFAGAPDLGGVVPETGAWSRQSLARARLAGHGPEPSTSDPGAPGPSAAMRMKARIREIALLSAWLAGGDHDEGPVADMVRSFRRSAGRGAAAVECARGRLYHAIELGPRGEIVAFEFLAPTEWNFHRQGPLARALGGMGIHGPQGRRSVEALVQSLDPCVGFQLRFRESAHA
ncbi:MAG: hydrogenase assembly protein HupF [Alphaproteobacteria bacterium]|nr:hydrogenase assembly protein HupF [Alphaproteobacteria bacterium]